MYWNINILNINALVACWIVTLDVLKYLSKRWEAPMVGWIVTLDVLKSNPVFKRFASCLVE